MSANVAAMVREGIAAFKAGKRDEARTLLLKAVELDQHNEEAWLWLSGILETVEDQRTCLENVLTINPNNERAKKGLAYLANQPAKPVPPLSGLANTPRPVLNRPTATSVEWEAPPASSVEPPASPWRQPPREPSDMELDEWVSRLNLPTAPAAPPAPSMPTPFSDIDFEAELDAGPFAAPSGAMKPPAPAPEASQPRERRAPVVPAPADEEEVDSLLFGGGLDDEGVLLDADEGALFAHIPPEIEATRLPGTRERAPLLLMLTAFILILVNVGAAVLVALRILA
jgi:hypothetical protein